MWRSILLSVLQPVLPTLRHISARKTASVTAKNFNSPSVLKKKNTAKVSPPDQDFSKLSPRKQPPYLRVRESNSVLFTDGDYVIM